MSSVEPSGTPNGQAGPYTVGRGKRRTRRLAVIAILLTLVAVIAFLIANRPSVRSEDGTTIVVQGLFTRGDSIAEGQGYGFELGLIEGRCWGNSKTREIMIWPREVHISTRAGHPVLITPVGTFEIGDLVEVVTAERISSPKFWGDLPRECKGSTFISVSLH